MKIVILTSSFPLKYRDPSGIFVYNLAKWISKKGMSVTVLAPHHKGSAFIESSDCFRICRFPYFFPTGLQKLCYGSGIIKNVKKQKPLVFQIPLFFLTQTIAAAYLAKKFKPDLIHAHWSIPQGLTGIIIKKMFHIPCITTIHGSDVFAMGHSLIKLLNRWVIQKSDICTVNSSATAQAAKTLTGRKDVVTIPMGVDTDFFRYKGKQEGLKNKSGVKRKVILYVGRLIDWKGVDFLIKSIPKILGRFPESKLFIVGDGPERQRLNKISEDLGINDNVVFTGRLSQEEIRNYYSVADVFVLPSIVNDKGETEGLGVVLLEAMSCGVPVIGSNVGELGI